MQDLRIDSLDRERCWNCGGKQFKEGDASSIDAQFSRKKLTCARCGASNKVGRAAPYDGPADPKYADEWRREQSDPDEHRPQEKPLEPDPTAGPTPAEAAMEELNRIRLINPDWPRI